MRRLRIALAACALFAAPVGLGAQQPSQPIVKPISPGHSGKPQPRPSGFNPNHKYPNRNNNSYTPYVYINAAPYLATPTPKPKPKQTPAHQNNNGQEVFSTYSTNNAK